MVNMLYQNISEYIMGILMTIKLHLKMYYMYQNLKRI